jgi:hypothetical protein
VCLCGWPATRRLGTENGVTGKWAADAAGPRVTAQRLLAGCDAGSWKATAEFPLSNATLLLRLPSKPHVARGAESGHSRRVGDRDLGSAKSHAYRTGAGVADVRTAGAKLEIDRRIARRSPVCAGPAGSTAAHSSANLRRNGVGIDAEKAVTAMRPDAPYTQSGVPLDLLVHDETTFPDYEFSAAGGPIGRVEMHLVVPFD